MKLSEITNVKLFDRGKRGVISTGIYNGKKVAIKVKRQESKAEGRIRNEAEWLQKLNAHGIGPRFLAYEDDSLIYEFVEGQFILAFAEQATEEELQKVILTTFQQLRQLDILGVDKGEMTHPQKHLLVTPKQEPVLIDFERCHATSKPQNVTQFVQFVTREPLKGKLGFSEPSREVMAEYKRTQSSEAFEKLLSALLPRLDR
ncbi:MAG: hypothetical protein V1735_00110 [Nanoarchaeota archaeon]